jgi:hypothetical protein
MAGTTLSGSTSLDQTARAFEPPAHAMVDPSTLGLLKQLTVKVGIRAIKHALGVRDRAPNYNL